jgi:2,3-bisphosphoglycerate-dependent phosphoglycerate mutase
MTRLILLRHGESVWNTENKFTGWTDVDLSLRGIIEAEQAGLLLKKDGFHFDVCYTSLLKRAIKTLWLVLETMDLMWVPVHKTWRLNERHYGGLQGRNKAEVAKEVGEEQVFAWRRSFRTRPPPLNPEDTRHPRHDPRYAHVDPALLPAAESLQDTAERVVPYWQKVIEPEVRKGKCVLISGHGNSLRALVQHLDRISDADVSRLEIPTGVPLIYELNEELKPIMEYYDLAPGKPRPIPGAT